MTAPDDISCPRCGYDLSGIRAAANTSHTPEGTCSECGLRFSWAELDSGRLNLPRFSFEHSPTLLAAPVRLLRTLGRSISGYRLWNVLRMQHEIRPLRLLLFAALALFLLHCTCVLLVLAVLYGPLSANWTARSPAAQLAWPYGMTPSFYMPGVGEVGVSLSVEEMLACGVTHLGTAGLLLMLRQTRRRFKVRKLHILRALCLGVPFVAGAFFLAELGASATNSLVAPNMWDSSTYIMLTTVGASIFLMAEILWWWCFCHCYLHAPHSLGIAIAGAILGCLACILLGLVTSSDWLGRMLT